jgi:hypothetical protein
MNYKQYLAEVTATGLTITSKAKLTSPDGVSASIVGTKSGAKGPVFTIKKKDAKTGKDVTMDMDQDALLASYKVEM